MSENPPDFLSFLTRFRGYLLVEYNLVKSVKLGVGMASEMHIEREKPGFSIENLVFHRKTKFYQLKKQFFQKLSFSNR